MVTFYKSLGKKRKEKRIELKKRIKKRKAYIYLHPFKPVVSYV